MSSTIEAEASPRDVSTAHQRKGETHGVPFLCGKRGSTLEPIAHFLFSSFFFLRFFTQDSTYYSSRHTRCGEGALLRPDRGGDQDSAPKRTAESPPSAQGVLTHSTRTIRSLYTPRPTSPEWDGPTAATTRLRPPTRRTDTPVAMRFALRPRLCVSRAEPDDARWHGHCSQ
jgi:hypothetical protein